VPRAPGGRGGVLKKAGKNKGFNTPFGKLSDKLKALEQLEHDSKLPAPAEAPPATQRSSSKEEDLGDDEALFLAAMAGAQPLRSEKQVVVREAPLHDDPTEWIQAQEDAEAMASLSDLVSGKGEFKLSDTEEWIDGLAPGVDPRLLRSLKRGEYSVQDHLDLHGEVQESARIKVLSTLSSARARGLRCVLIIHGRGHGSPGGVPVLKTALVRWLSRGELGRQVLCFCTALPSDGGAGAIYVLLRR